MHVLLCILVHPSMHTCSTRNWAPRLLESSSSSTTVLHAQPPSTQVSTPNALKLSPQAFLLPPCLSCAPITTGTTQQSSHWFPWVGCSWQLSCVCNPADDTFSLKVTFCSKESDGCKAYIALQVLDRREDRQHCTRYLPPQHFSQQQPTATLEHVLSLSELRQPHSPYVLNDSLLVAAQLSTEPLSPEQGLRMDQMQVVHESSSSSSPFNTVGASSSIRTTAAGVAAGHRARCVAPNSSSSNNSNNVPSPFASMFSGDLTRFLSGTAFAEVRLGALGVVEEPSDKQQPMLCHASRLTRVSEVLRVRLGPLLKTLPARPSGYGGIAAQPLVLLEAPVPVLRLFHKMLYEATVSMPAGSALLGGVLQLAVQYDMPELELWALQQGQSAGLTLPTPRGTVYIEQQLIVLLLSRGCWLFGGMHTSERSDAVREAWMLCTTQACMPG